MLALGRTARGVEALAALYKVEKPDPHSKESGQDSALRELHNVVQGKRSPLTRSKV